MKANLSFLTGGFLSAGLGGAQQPMLVIENVTRIDGTGRPPVAVVTFLFEGNRIRRVVEGPAEAPSGARRIDGKGKYAIPGLMDMHIHLHGGRLGPHLEANEGAPPDEKDGILKCR